MSNVYVKKTFCPQLLKDVLLGHHGLMQVHVYLIPQLEMDFGIEDVVAIRIKMIQLTSMRAMMNMMLLNAYQENVKI